MAVHPTVEQMQALDYRVTERDGAIVVESGPSTLGTEFRPMEFVITKADQYAHTNDFRTILAGTYRRSSSKVGRNDQCPCGSGKKFKRCCAER